MLRSRRSRLIALLSLAIFASGWVRVPVPAALIPDELTLQDRVYELNVDRVRVSWARGRVDIRGLRVRLDGREILVAPRARVLVGLLPFQPGFLRPDLVEATGPEIDLDAEVVRGLPASERGDGPLPELAFRVLGGRLRWTTAGGARMTWEVDELTGRLNERRSDVRLSGNMLEPIQSFVRAKASAQAGMRSWWFQIEGENSAAEDAWRPQDIRALRGIEVRPGQYSFRFAAAKRPGEALRSDLTLNLQGAGASIAEPPLELADLQLHASGGLREGVRAEISAVVDEEFRVLGGGRMQWPENGAPWMALRGDSTTVRVDQDRLDWVRLLHPNTADILEALEIRGGPEARFSLDWQAGTPVAWGVHADTGGMRMRYRGIVMSSGAKPSFPYPVESTRGDFVAVGNVLLMDVAGRAGVGTVSGRGAVEIHADDASVHLDVAARNVAVDREVRAAATGTPQIAELWRQLGIPQGGTADVDLRIRTDRAREYTGITIGGTARQVAIRPAELPIPALVDEIDFFWTPGYAAFHGTGRASDTELRVHGELRDAADARWPSLRAALECVDPAPDLRTRRVLVDRLGMPDWMTLFEPSGPGALRIDYHLPATAEAPQYLLRADLQGGSIGWGTAFGNRFVSLMRGDSLQGRFHMGGADDEHRFVAPRLDAQFGGRDLLATLAGGESERVAPRLLVSSEDLVLNEATATALTGLLGLDPWLQGARVTCRSDLLLDWSAGDDVPLHARLRLRPLRVLLPGGGEPIELSGQVIVGGTGIESPRLRLERGKGWIEATDLVAELAPERRSLDALLRSGRGVALEPELFAMLGPTTGGALADWGLRGAFAPRDVHVHWEHAEDELPWLTLTGGVLDMEAVALDRPLAIEDGAATVALGELSWSEDRGVVARLQVADGRAVVAGVPVAEARAALTFDGDRLLIRDAEASALGGWIRTPVTDEPLLGFDPAGLDFDVQWPVGHPRPIPGTVSLGLDPSLPLTADLAFGDLRLDAVPDGDQVAPGMRGELSGWLVFASSTPEVLDWIGRGRIEVENGRLTTVPVLQQLWELLGIDPPVFRRGDLDFRLDGDLRARVEGFTLDHDLLNVEGKGWIHFDGRVRLKVSLRRVMLFLGLPLTDLPVLSQLFDLFIEQEVFGPTERLQLAPRSVRKILGRDLPEVPMPLWVPRAERAPDGRSPALPAYVDREAEARADG